MISDFYLVPVFDFVGLFVHIYPIEYWRARRDGGDESFALPAPVVLRVWEEVACERVAGGLLKFKLVFDRDIEILDCLDIELKAGYEYL